MKKVTLTDIANALGLSFTAVCKVLNKDPECHISQDTRSLILSKAKEMGYDASKLRRIYRRKSERITVNIPAEITIKSPDARKIFTRGRVTIKNISDVGVLITDIRLKNNCLPIKPFICELYILGGKFKKKNLIATPVRIMNDGKLCLGLAI
jgi:hypothetical protein